MAASRSEYINGRIYAMAGGSYEHGVIAVSVGAELRRAIQGQNCRVSSSDVRVRVVASNLYTYPDVAVVRGEVEFDSTGGDTVLNPSLLVEVLSPSTEAYDRGDKWAHYQLVPSLRHYLLVSQDRVRVECYTRLPGAGSWRLEVCSDLEGTIRLEHLRAELSLAEVYLGIDLTDGHTESRSPRV